jgi:hypothetical protein
MKKLLSLSLLALACGSFPEDAEPTDLGQTDQALTALRHYSWIMDSGNEHMRCDMERISSDCAFPVRANTLNGFRRLLIAPIETTAVPSGFNLVDARVFGTSYFTNMSNAWEWAMTTQGSAADLKIVSDENIYNGTPPNDTIDLATVAHVSCTFNQFQYEEDRPGRAYGCKSVTAKLDVGSFTAWVNQWATTNSQRQGALDSVYRHFLGVAMGLGATNSTDTVMRRRLSRAQSPGTIQNYEKCMLDAVNFNDPNYIDPELGVFANGC